MRNLYKEYEFSDELGRSFIRQSFMNEIVSLKSKIREMEEFLREQSGDYISVDNDHFN